MVTHQNKYEQCFSETVKFQFFPRCASESITPTVQYPLSYQLYKAYHQIKQIPDYAALYHWPLQQRQVELNRHNEADGFSKSFLFHALVHFLVLQNSKTGPDLLILSAPH